MTMITADSPRTRTTPEEVRHKDFTVRLRGLDHNEVRSFLDALADDLEQAYAQVSMLTKENDQLSAEVEQARANPHDQVTDHAVVLLNQAQQLADALIDEAMQSARDLLLTARSQQRDIVEQANTAAQGAVARATATAERVVSEDASPEDVEYIKMFARVAQVQFRAVLDALNEQINRLGEAPDVGKRLRVDQESSDGRGGWLRASLLRESG
jgi:cell division initiation protein